MMNDSIIYSCPGRSFRSDQPRRKMKDIIACWRNLGCHVDHVCGGDFFAASQNLNAPAGRTGHYNQWFRKNPLLMPLVATVSERRNLKNNQQIKQKLEQLVGQKKPSLIWERSTYLYDAGLDIAKSKNIPYVLEWKDNVVPYKFSLHHRKGVQLEKRKIQESDFIVVESERIRMLLIEEGVNKKKIIVAQNAVNPDEFTRDPKSANQFRNELQVPENEVLVGYVGGYSWYHDMPRLILAAEIVYNEDVPMKFLLVGAGYYYEQICQMIEDRPFLKDRILMKPWVPAEQVPSILSALDIAVLPGCTNIICPIKVQEYMAMELPAVVPDYACNREVVTHGQTGMLFEPKNEKALADVLKELLQNPEKRKLIGHQARREVQEKFTWEQTWGRALQEVLQRIGA